MITPQLVLDSKEKWRPVPVEESLKPYGYTFNGDVCLHKEGPVSRINLPNDLVQPRLPVVVYHRVKFSGNLYHHQFWTWWLYNPKKYPPTKHGIGDHEGDWEMVQLSCIDRDGDVPIAMGCSQHGGAERRFYWDVELSEGKEGQPVVYVARDSHANYFSPVQTVTDVADGKGHRLTPIYREFDKWCNWTGVWGNSDNSPGPLTPRRAWRAPHAWLSQARG